MPLYVGDYLGDTMHLRMAEHGAYVLLMLHYWRNGPLPDDDRALAAIARAERKEWAEAGPVVRAFFIPRDGKLHHKRIDAERAKASALAGKRSAAASARWGKGTSKPDANAEQEQCNADAFASGLHDGRTSPSPSQSKKEGSVLRTDAPGASGDGLFGALPQDRAQSMRATLFRDGLPILAALTGKGDGQCRGLIGKWLAAMDDDCARLYAVLREAEGLKPVDPMAWLTAAVRPRADRSGKTDWIREEMRGFANGQ